MRTSREVAESNVILRCVVGSTAHGLALEGKDDHDEMAVCLEPPEYVIGLERFEQWVHCQADMFASLQAGHRFRGYLHAQKQRLLGIRGQMRVTRTELIERHGYDTKFAMHAVRLGFQGIEYMSTGRLTLPLAPAESEICMGIRRGRWLLNDVVELIEDQERRLAAGIKASRLPDHPDHGRINAFLVDAYRHHWR
jgi:uncharacterized protein